jgi:hypothetical protein
MYWTVFQISKWTLTKSIFSDMANDISMRFAVFDREFCCASWYLCPSNFIFYPILCVFDEGPTNHYAFLFVESYIYWKLNLCWMMSDWTLESWEMLTHVCERIYPCSHWTLRFPVTLITWLWPRLLSSGRDAFQLNSIDIGLTKEDLWDFSKVIS